MTNIMTTAFKLISPLVILLSTTTLSATTLNFTIDGIQSNQGKIYIQLFQGEENYQNNKPYVSSIAIAKQGSITVAFNDLAPNNLNTETESNNDYGIRYYHDENNNGSMETNLFGMPLEGYGYSNNAKANYGPVKYSKIKFQIADETVINTSTIVY